MLNLGNLSRAHRMMLGIVVLLIVDIIWVISAELTKYIFQETDFNKPFFTTYVKTVMFSVYLLGFIVWKPWRVQCYRNKVVSCLPLLKKIDGQVVKAAIILSEIFTEETRPISPQTEQDSMIGSPIFVPVKHENYDSYTSGGESDDASSGGCSKSVRFSNLSEVRQLSEEYAVEHNLARLSYQASVEAEQKLNILHNRLPLGQVIKLAFYFCLLWFFANCTYQEALNQTEASVVNVLSSTSGLTTLICAAIFPSGPSDRFTLTKLFVVFISLGGVTMVCLSDATMENSSVPIGAIWALVSAVSYAFYLVLIKRKVQNEDKMDIPMFFGFVGLMCALVLWPGFFILHYTGKELFEWPNKRQWMFIILNGLIGTVFSEFLWLLGCFLSSSLIATLALSLVIPLNMFADGFIKGISFKLIFYLGTIPIILSFFGVSFLTHWENWDPVLLGMKKCLHCICRRRSLVRVRELDREQTASLITEESHH